MKSTQVTSLTCHCQVKSSQVECDQVDGGRLGVDFSLKSGHVSVPHAATRRSSDITVVMVCYGIFFIDRLGWVGLGYENWTYGHVWTGMPLCQ